jgi:hypothetical protein
MQINLRDCPKLKKRSLRLNLKQKLTKSSIKAQQMQSRKTLRTLSKLLQARKRSPQPWLRRFRNSKNLKGSRKSSRSKLNERKRNESEKKKKKRKKPKKLLKPPRKQRKISKSKRRLSSKQKANGLQTSKRQTKSYKRLIDRG